MSPPRRAVPAWLVNVILSVLAFALLGLAVWMNQDELLGVFEREINKRLFALSFGVYLAALVLTFFRWYLLVRALDLPFRFRDALRLGFIGNVFNLVIPGAVGGDVIKGAFLCREQSRKTQAVASMVIDRLVGLIGLFLLAGLSGIGAWSGANTEVRTLISLTWIAAIGGLIGLAVLFTPTLYQPMLLVLSRNRRLATMLEELVKMASAYRARAVRRSGADASATFRDRAAHLVHHRRSSSVRSAWGQRTCRKVPVSTGAAPERSRGDDGFSSLDVRRGTLERFRLPGQSPAGPQALPRVRVERHKRFNTRC
jgi:hypothetical protein